MFCRLCVIAVCSLAFAIASPIESASAQEKAYGASWGNRQTSQNLDRFYHYPYVTYPHNYWSNQYYQSADSMYYRYPQEMRIPVYNKAWHNYYPSSRRYHWGHQFLTDIF